jgi:hypothetical protein
MTDSHLRSGLFLDRSALADLVTDIWRVRKRAERLTETPEPVELAVERTWDRLEEMGFHIDEMLDTPYDESLRLRVAHHEGGSDNLRIVECIVPAIYFRSSADSTPELLRAAEVVIRGDIVLKGDQDAATDC